MFYSIRTITLEYNYYSSYLLDSSIKYDDADNVYVGLILVQYKDINCTAKILQSSESTYVKNVLNTFQLGSTYKVYFNSDMTLCYAHYHDLSSIKQVSLISLFVLSLITFLGTCMQFCDELDKKSHKNKTS